MNDLTFIYLGLPIEPLSIAYPAGALERGPVESERIITLEL